MPPDASAAVQASRTGEGEVIRPDPGTLARGVWEAPPWAFYAAAAVVVLAAVLYGAFQANLFRRRPRP